MPAVGLILSIETGTSASLVAADLRRHSSLTVGEAAGCWLPVAVEAEDDAGCRELHDWIAAQPGVAFVDVVHVNFEADDADVVGPVTDPDKLNSADSPC
jgi:hypothetical protein